MLNYENKFKERSPQETINIIQKYFNSLGYNIKIIMCDQTNVNTWCSRIVLYYNDMFVLGTNGKGTTKDYCLASAYGEMYERFCNRMGCTNHYIIGEHMINITKEKKGYYFHPEEKSIDFNEAFNSSYIGQSFLNVCKNYLEETKEYFNTILNNNYIGVPYKHSHKNDVIYLEPRIVTFLTGSSGMSAGNTFYEAYVQAISELYEHYVIGLYCDKPQTKYYAINLNAIKNTELLTIIHKIKQENDLYIIDFSYNFQVPVLMALVVNKKTHTITINFGSSPIFDIALERILTELYQGRQEGFNFYKTYGQFPFKGNFNYKTKDLIYRGSQTYMKAFPEFIIQNLVEINSYNREIFTNLNLSNEDLYEYTKYINEINNFDVYYYNASGCKEMYAIKLFSPNISHLEVQFEGLNGYINEDTFIYGKLLYNIIKTYINTQTVNLIDFNMFNDYITSLPKYHKEYFLFILFSTWFCFENALNFNTDDLSQLTNMLLFDIKELTNIENHFITKFDSNPAIYEQLINFSTLLRYALNQNYESKEVIKILEFLNINIDINDINNIYHKEYLIKKIVFADINKYLNHYYDNYLLSRALYNEVCNE